MLGSEGCVLKVGIKQGTDFILVLVFLSFNNFIVREFSRRAAKRIRVSRIIQQVEPSLGKFF